MSEEIEAVIDKAREFLDAAYRREYVGMKAALESAEDATIYSVDDTGNTTLHYAVFAKANSGGDY